jgi:uncharacterized membrane protein YhaH (DUF805 family)
MHCTNCGEKLESEAKFCTKCGAVVGGAHYTVTKSRTSKSPLRIGRLGRLAFFIGLLIGPLVFGLMLALGLPDTLTGIVAIVWLVWLLAIIVGRAHDLGYSAWFSILIILVCAIPGVNAIMLIALCAMASKEAGNKYGLPPSGSVSELLIFWRAA